MNLNFLTGDFIGVLGVKYSTWRVSIKLLWAFRQSSAESWIFADRKIAVTKVDRHFVISVLVIFMEFLSWIIPAQNFYTFAFRFRFRNFAFLIEYAIDTLYRIIASARKCPANYSKLTVY